MVGSRRRCGVDGSCSECSRSRISLARRDAGPGASEPPWLVPGLIAVVLVFALSAGVLFWRRQSRSPLTQRLLAISTPARTQRVARALREGGGIDDSDREVAQLLVDQVQRQRRTGWPSLAIGALLLVAPWWGDAGTVRWVVAGLGVLEVAVGVLKLTAGRRALRNAARESIYPYTSRFRRLGSA